MSNVIEMTNSRAQVYTCFIAQLHFSHAYFTDTFRLLRLTPPSMQIGGMVSMKQL